MLTELEQRLVVGVCLLSRFLAAAVYSLQAPFFPHEAEKKEVTPSQYGLVFSIYEVIVLVTAPIVGANIHRIGTKFGICCGLFVAAYACIIFGFLSMVDGKTTFFALAITIRIFEGLGQAASSICTFTLLLSTFPDTANAKLGYTGTAFSSGMMAGPAIGGALFSIGGFLAPFLSVGVFLLFCLAISIKVFPASRITDQTDKNGLSMLLLKKREIHLGMFSCFSCTVSLGFLAATMEPHLRKFNYSPSYTSLFFLITPMTYAITNPITGKVLDRKVEPRKFILLGASLKILAFCLIGPFPWIPVNPNPYMVGIGLVVNGLANSCQLLPGLDLMKKTAKELNRPSNEMTLAVVSAIFQVSLSLGLCIGPLVGGILSQIADFRKGLVAAIAINIVLVFWSGLSLGLVKSRRQQEEGVELERQPLLQDTSKDSLEHDSSTERKLSIHYTPSNSSKGGSTEEIEDPCSQPR